MRQGFGIASLMMLVVVVQVLPGAPEVTQGAVVSQFHEVPVATIQALPGTAPLVTDCGAGGDFCSAFAFLGPDGNAYIYDYAHGALGIMSPATHSITRVMTGGPRSVWVRDGAATADGTVYLLWDSGAARDRYQIFYRTAADTSWRTADPPDDAEMGWRTTAGHRLPVIGGMGLNLNPLGQVELCDHDRRTNPAVVIADNSGVLPKARRYRVPAGWIAPGDRRVRVEGGRTVVEGAGQSHAITAPGAFLGTDSLGNVYLRSLRREPGGAILQRYSPEGQLLASVDVPSRRVSALVSGKGPYLVNSDGDVYQFRLTPQGLVVTRWTTRGDQ
jgi:hypothetical protein